MPTRSPTPHPTPRPVTSHDVAKLAGVSRTAVSRAFTPGARIAPETREKVFEAARSLGYRVNYLARGLINRRSDLVGVVAADLDNPFRALQIERITEALVSQNLRPILLISRGQDTERLIGLLLHYAVSGVIVTSDAPPRELCEECAAAGVPIVLIDKGDDIAEVDRVVSDTEDAGRRAIELLVSAGARRLAVMGNSDVSFTARQRRGAFLAHGATLGLAPLARPLVRNDYASGREAMRALVDAGIDGVFCTNDYIACGAIDALRDMGLKAGTDVKVVGHDDIPQAQWSAYQLTTFAQPLDLSAQRAIAFLSSRGAAPETPARVSTCPVTLVRRTTA